MNIIINPITKRAKQRVKEHGIIMTLIKEGSFKGAPAILVESISETCRCGNKTHKWLGWFTKAEASWSELCA